MIRAADCPLEGSHFIWLGSPGRLLIVDVDQIQRRQIMMQPLSYYHEEGWGGELRGLSPAFVLKARARVSSWMHRS